jgi:hypothetical protein
VKYLERLNVVIVHKIKLVFCLYIAKYEYIQLSNKYYSLLLSLSSGAKKRNYSTQEDDRKIGGFSWIQMLEWRRMPGGSRERKY